ncbi:hypothetical protein GCM10027610_071510 [Dactylosporangium cerinum]
MGGAEVDAQARVGMHAGSVLIQTLDENGVSSGRVPPVGRSHCAGSDALGIDAVYGPLVTGICAGLSSL